jgi:hypothetical protein
LKWGLAMWKLFVGVGAALMIFPAIAVFFYLIIFWALISAYPLYGIGCILGILVLPLLAFAVYSEYVFRYREEHSRPPPYWILVYIGIGLSPLLSFVLALMYVYHNPGTFGSDALFAYLYAMVLLATPVWLLRFV